MKLSELRQLLADHDLCLTKSLGQNFLHDGNQVRRILEAAQLGLADRVLEIGPGLGALTEGLLERAGEVVAIELDPRLGPILRERFKEALNLRLVQANALEYLRHQPCDWSGWKLVANLPYSVASPLLVELALSQPGPERMVATVQREVARRLMARAGHSDYGLLTLLVQQQYRPAREFVISASCFFPPPGVDSACVVLERRTPSLVSPDLIATFVRLAKRGFSQRRKMMFKLLKHDWAEDRLAVGFAATGLSPQVRAEAVSLEQFVQLARYLQPPGPVG